MVADLRRCVGCQTCTAACKHANATPPGVQWRRVIDMEVGEYPDVQRAVRAGRLPALRRTALHGGVPEHGDEEARRRHRHHRLRPVHRLRLLRRGLPLPGRATRPSAPASPTAARAEQERKRQDDGRPGVATKCTFCVDRIDYGTENNLTPGVDPEATPARVNARIAQALRLRRSRRSAEQRVQAAGREPELSCTRNWAPARLPLTCGIADGDEPPPKP